ncbi:MAG TPA: MarR family transcriptional regulator [Pyrinomonadaceae bacterium]|jgi:DNA-binding MarR family transcriptional regulator|nr:MarR family transcriptional regulator [Pyrinomonadaceae bacterium]
MDKLRERLRQSKPFEKDAERVFLTIQLVAGDHSAAIERVFCASDLTATQYNVLRILRGAKSDGLSCREIGERMITRDPDITRMLDRLEGRDLIRRERQETDRRVIRAFITQKGLDLLKELDRPIAGTTDELFAGVSKSELATLSRLLAKMLRTE